MRLLTAILFITLSITSIRRLGHGDAERIVDCFRRVYGETYANPDFYDPSRLAALLRGEELCSVGAELPSGRLVGHMGMSRHPGATSTELGNTVVDPAARGEGVAWRVGAELARWAVELGYRAYLHYPTTAHHIMQRQSVGSGFETGLMLGYIPPETDGKTSAGESGLRQAATIVYQPLGQAHAGTSFLPEEGVDRIREWALAAGTPRTWQHPKGPPATATVARVTRHARRGLARLTLERVGADVATVVADFTNEPFACRQIDFRMSDRAIDVGVRAAQEAGYWFCGWLPGFSSADVYRVQKVDRSCTEMNPGVINPVAKALVELVPA